MSTSAAKEALRRSKAALRKGDKDLARRWAEKAASLAPQLEAPWLLLAATSRPQLSIHYLERALAINPESAAAQKGMRWAKKKLEATKKQKAAREDQEEPELESTKRHEEARSDKNGGILRVHTRLDDTQPKSAFTRVRTTPREDTQPSKAIEPKAPSRFWRQSLPALLLTVFLVSLVWAAMPHNSSLAASMPRISSFVASMQATPTATFSQEHWGEGEMAKPTYTPSPTATFTATPTPTITPTPTSTSTPVPPTKTPRPANTAAPVVDDPAPVGGKYVLVDISEQHLYAYQGNTLVYSFVASTGMANNATATGHFSILNKIPNAYGATWDIWMPYWLGIYWVGTMQNGIHALPIMSNGATLWSGYLGSPISYGCVVLGSYDAQLLYNWVDIGTPVDIQW